MQSNAREVSSQSAGSQSAGSQSADSSVAKTFDARDLDDRAAGAIAAALEENKIVRFPTSPIPLPDEATLRYLRAELPQSLRLKNVSYHPQGQRLVGMEADASVRERTEQVLREHLDAVSAFLRRVVPHLCGDWTIGKTSFRPIQERGRNLSAHASNELIHVDAGAYGATHGNRILRFFLNVNETEDRVWVSKGPVQDVLRRHGAAAGLLDESGRLRMRIHENFADRLLSSSVRGLGHLNSLAKVLDSSPYDRAMRQLHNYMKDSESFKSDREGFEEIRFPPGSAWMVFTDGVSHACTAGQFAFVTTMLIRRASLRYPQFAPYDLLAAHATNAH
jgi:hypothetical protein